MFSLDKKKNNTLINCMIIAVVVKRAECIWINRKNNRICNKYINKKKKVNNNIECIY